MLDNKQLIELLIQEGMDINNIANYLLVILKIKKKWGSRIFTKTFIATIQKSDETIAAILTALKRLNKLNDKKIKDLLKKIKESKDYKPKVFIEVSDKNRLEEIEDFVSKNIDNASISTEQADFIGIKISGDAESYKRDYYQDVQKILSE